MRWLLPTSVTLCLTLRVSGDKPIVIPAIREWSESTGKNFTYDLVGARIIYDTALREVAELFKYDLAIRSAAILTAIDAADESPQSDDFYFKVETYEEKLGEEGYKIVIGDFMTITANSRIGYRRGSMTLLQLASEMTVSTGTIYDYPQSKKRWLLLDCARHFFRFEYIHDLIKVLAHYKMNGLILHAVDAEAFRFETLKHPELPTEGGYYTRAQIIELVRLGEDYGVDIIPGFEFPGHSTAFNSALGTGLPQECAGSVYPWVTVDWIMDITKAKSLELTQEVLLDVLRWFPSSYVHLGADELPDISDNCPVVRAYLDAHPDLESYGDMVAVWIEELAEWLRTSLSKQAIIFNGMERTLKKVSVPKKAIVQFWDQAETDTYLRDYLRDGYKILNSFPSQDIFYLTPNAYHYIFPNLDLLMDKGIASALPPETAVEGYVFNIWCDYIYWADDAYIEEHAALPRAMIASMAWNSDVSQYSDVTNFTRIFNTIEAPQLVSSFKRASDEHLIELHHYSFEDEAYEASVIKSCPWPLCLFVRDNVGSLHGSTYIANPPDQTNRLVQGKYGAGLRWNDSWSKEGVGFGGVDIPPPWTWSAWIRVHQTSDLMPLFWSPQGALMLATPGEGLIGLVKFPNKSTMQHYSASTTFPADNRFHHLLFTAKPGEDDQVGQVDVYLDGELVTTLSVDFDLPMAAIMGYFPLDSSAPTQSLITLDEIRILSGHASKAEVIRLKSESPSVAYNNPGNIGLSHAGPLQCFSAIAGLSVLYSTTS